MKNIVGRWQLQKLRSALASRRGVHLTGARQCGKTTLVRSIADETMRLVSLDEDAYFNAARDDPYGFVMRGDGETLVIDEVQKVPALLNAIKRRLDDDDTRGQYLLTGSSNLLFAKEVKDSLAGRLRTIRLRTLTEGEVRSGKGDFIQRALVADFPAEIPGWGKRDVLHLAYVGGYPEARQLDSDELREWYRGYLNDLLVKDIRDITEIRKIDALRVVSDWLIAHSSKYFESNELCARAGLSKETLDNYLSALQALYVFDRVKPWSGSDYARLGKRGKWFAADSGFLGNVLGWNEDEVYYQDDACGKLVETWAYHELASLVDLHPEFTLTQYRDSDRHEIDFMLDNADVTIGIEVKAGSVASAADFRSMKWFASTLSRKRFVGIVLYSGHSVLRFGDGFHAVPFGALAL